MAENKKSILVYADWISIFEELQEEEAGRLIKHFFRYVNDLNPEPPDRITKLLFEPIKQTLKRDLKKYEAICLRNRANGSKGGRPKQTFPDEPRKPSGLNTNPENPDKPDSDSDSDSDNGKEEIIFNRDFENFRLAYPGVKRGFDTEFKNFQKRHKDWRLILPILLPNLQRQIQDRARIKTGGGFVPEWQHLQTYINQSSWEITYESKKKEEVLAPRGPAYQQAAKDII